MTDTITGKVYAIKSKKTELIYIGSTTNWLKYRFSQHKCYFKRYKLGDEPKTQSYKIFEIDENCYIELIQSYEVESIEELRRYEGEHIRNNTNCVNKYIAGRTKKEYTKDNKDKTKEYQKQYQMENHEKIATQHAVNYQKNKDVISVKSKELYKKNVDVIKARVKKYALNNKEKVNAASKKYRDSHKVEKAANDKKYNG